MSNDRPEGSTREVPSSLSIGEVAEQRMQRRAAIELLDDAGRVLPGFAAGDCEVVRGDVHAHTVKWKGGVRAPGAAAKARLILQRAFVYGMEWAKA